MLPDIAEAAIFSFNLAEMKTLMLLLTFTSAVLLAGCQSQSTKEPSPIITVAPNTSAPVAVATAVNLTGDWGWVCCDGSYHGELKLQQDANKLTGRMYDENDTVGGAIEGTVTNGKVQFTRLFGEDLRQDYTLTVTDDGKKLTGNFDGTRDESVGAHFDATRK